jgi:hypothetical protein
MKQRMRSIVCLFSHFMDRLLLLLFVVVIRLHYGSHLVNTTLNNLNILYASFLFGDSELFMYTHT